MPRAHDEVSSTYTPETTKLGMEEIGDYMANRGPNMPHQPQKKNAKIE